MNVISDACQKARESLKPFKTPEYDEKDSRCQAYDMFGNLLAPRLLRDIGAGSDIRDFLDGVQVVCGWLDKIEGYPHQVQLAKEAMKKLEDAMRAVSEGRTL